MNKDHALAHTSHGRRLRNIRTDCDAEVAKYAVARMMHYLRMRWVVSPLRDGILVGEANKDHLSFWLRWTDESSLIYETFYFVMEYRLKLAVILLRLCALLWGHSPNKQD